MESLDNVATGDHPGGLAPWLLGSNDLSLPEILAEQPRLQEALSIYEPIYTAGIFGGLLTEPALQCNCCRLEALSHFAIAFSEGTRKPSKTAISTWFSGMSAGICGRFEDPSEDVFASVVTTPRGNFRIIEGIWESAGFYLQRVVNVLEGMPADGYARSLRESIYSLLKLSDLICERAELQRYAAGNQFPESELPRSIAASLQSYRQRVVFTHSELRAEEISVDSLTLFTFRPTDRGSIERSTLSHSPLLHRPLVTDSTGITVALPTAISIAIRAAMINTVITMGQEEALVKAIASEYRQFFDANPVLGAELHGPINFAPSEHGVIATFAGKVDTGRYLQLIFAIDTLTGFEEAGFAGMDPDFVEIGSDFDSAIDACRASLLAREDCWEGFTLIVTCGVGRGQGFALSNASRREWPIAHIAAADIATLNLLGDIQPLTLWRIIRAEQGLKDRSIRLLNINGVLNLVAWARHLGGHLLPHSDLPGDFGSGRHSFLLIDQSMIRDLRFRAMTGADRHAELAVDGTWVEVQRLRDSFFSEDKSLPLYFCTDRQHDCGGGFPTVFLTATRRWWCEVVYPRKFERWKLMNAWLPKIATVLDRQLTALPPGALLLRVNFAACREPVPAGRPLRREEIQHRISVEVDTSKSGACDRRAPCLLCDAWQAGSARCPLKTQGLATAAARAARTANRGFLPTRGTVSGGGFALHWGGGAVVEHGRECESFGWILVSEPSPQQTGLRAVTSSEFAARG
jgi:hypothetical protein